MEAMPLDQGLFQAGACGHGRCITTIVSKVPTKTAPCLKHSLDDSPWSEVKDQACAAEGGGLLDVTGSFGLNEIRSLE